MNNAINQITTFGSESNKIARDIIFDHIRKKACYDMSNESILDAVNQTEEILDNLRKAARGTTDDQAAPEPTEPPTRIYSEYTDISYKLFNALKKEIVTRVRGKETNEMATIFIVWGLRESNAGFVLEFVSDCTDDSRPTAAYYHETIEGAMEHYHMAKPQ